MTTPGPAESAAANRERAPAPGQHLEVGEGIVWIRLPIPGGLKHINVWLVPARSGWLLVDTGMRTAAVEQAWLDLEGQLPLAHELRGIVVTHHHPDHFGMARWLSERHQVPVHMSRHASMAATGTLAGGEARTDSPSDNFATRVGIEVDDALRPIMRGITYRSVVSGPVESPAELADGAILTEASHGWEISLHEGHAPGHACLYGRAAGTLISGDQVLPRISSNISLYPSNEDRDPLGEYLASLDRLATLPADTLVLPAHGLPFSTLHARIAALRAEHAARLEQVRSALVEPQATTHVVAQLFNVGRLDALNRLLATTETLAHLRHLELQGQLSRRGEGRDLRWQLC